MRYHEITKEAEMGTPESNKINDTLKKAGYKQLGQGADATVWSKDIGTVIKIIMPSPDSASDSGGPSLAEKIFIKFYEFVSENQQYENLPRFIEIGGKHHSKFKIGNKEYIQTAMEQLYPIDEYGIEGDIVTVLSVSAPKRLSWEKVIQRLSTPGEDDVSKTTIAYIKNLDRTQLAKLHILYQLMVVMYHTGRINKFGWDVHTMNVMTRKDGTLVITDPWYSYMGSK